MSIVIKKVFLSLSIATFSIFYRNALFEGIIMEHLNQKLVSVRNRVVKNLKISPLKVKAYLPQAYGPWEESFSSRGLIFEVFSTLGMKKFPFPNVLLVASQC